MDIKDRAEKWALEYRGMCDCPRRQDLVAAYLAGSAQTQADYTRTGPLTVWFHSEDGCPGHIVVAEPGQRCPRCSCTCGAP